jgi:hypothetical protein
MATRRRNEFDKARKEPRPISAVVLTVLCALGWTGLYAIQRSNLLSLEAITMIIVLAVLVAILVIAPKY